jgi:hypothetical protein
VAKIALITQTLSPQALGLAQALQFHRHDVTLITSYHESVPDNLGFPVLTYFKSWSVLEALKFFPRILGQAPEIWHFVFSDRETDKPMAAQWLLAQLARALPRRVIAASFYESLLHMSKFRMIPMLNCCDIVTTATRESLMYLKRRSWLPKFCETEVLPPFLHSESASNDVSLDQDLKQLLNTADPYLLVPSEKLGDLDWEQILGKVQILVCGRRPSGKTVPGVYYIGHSLSDFQFKEVLKNSIGLLTAFEDFSLIELLRFHRLCQETKTPVIANMRQTEALPGYSVENRNGFVLNQISNLRQLISENPRLELQSPHFETARSELADSALNELNRLYSKVQHLKSSSIDFKRSPIS